LLDFLDGLVKLNLRVARPEVPDALRVDEDDVLLAAHEQPQDEVGVEVAGLEEAHAAALAEVAQQVELSGPEEGGLPVVEGLEVFDKQAFALVQRRRADLDDL
jgi:hypothetical protein